MHNNLELAAGGIITYSATQYQQHGIQKLLEQYCKEGGKVLILNDSTVKDYTKLYMDEFAGGRLAAQMLIESNCQNFFCFRGEEVENSVTQMRYEGFSSKLRENGAICHLVDNLFEIPEFVKKTPSSGVFTVTDTYAITLMQLAYQEGISAPDDFKLVGYDNLDCSAILGLSTIHQPFREEGRIAANKIIQMIYGNEEKDEIIIPSAIVRKTTLC
jgi:LacI family sucrose operon transcriptional repressor